MVRAAASATRLLFVLGILFSNGADVGQAATVEDAIRNRVEAVGRGKPLRIANVEAAALKVLPQIYERRDFALTWTEARTIDDLLTAIRGIGEDGLDPADYHLDTLERLRAEVDANPSDANLRADLDVLLTDSLTRLAYHLFFGKVDAQRLDANWNFDRKIRSDDPARTIQNAIDSGDLGKILDGLRPNLPAYARFRKALVRYREIAAQGGWPTVPDGPTLKPGMRDERVGALRRRLEVTGDLQPTGNASTLYDEALEAAVKRFQERHLLDADGVVGKKSLAALNRSVEEKIDQIRVNLERARWVLHDLPADFIVTDIAGFEVGLFRNKELSWRSRVQVGKPYRKTPVFRSEIKYLVLNPTWTVPPGILAKDILPKVKKDPGYLATKNLKVIDSNGKVIPPGQVDWGRYTGRNFPYQLRQDPGPTNALGRVKFIFPNKHAVYLHDTPSKTLFERSERAFSSGCIRVQNPFELAELLLEGTEWDRARIEATLASGKLTNVNLPKPLPVMLLYWTVRANDDGSAVFKPDIYDRDAAVLRKLDSKFVFRRATLPGQK
jgi:murein L,D-transpeptidase YcbB/YkuD